VNEVGLVLVVEDSPTQGQMVSTMIRILCGLNVVIAADGSQAMQAIHTNQPNVIVLDVNLPDMDGYQLCNRLKRDPLTAHIPIIMLTSMHSDQATTRGLAAGANDYIPKDGNATENLISALRRYIDFH
jgi:CheY-like chemotaxis protein